MPGRLDDDNNSGLVQKTTLFGNTDLQLGRVHWLANAMKVYPDLNPDPNHNPDLNPDRELNLNPDPNPNPVSNPDPNPNPLYRWAVLMGHGLPFLALKKSGRGRCTHTLSG